MRRLPGNAVELGDVRIASEAVSGGGGERLVSAIEITPVRAEPRAGKTLTQPQIRSWKQR
jgi:hypothetical protein